MLRMRGVHGASPIGNSTPLDLEGSPEKESWPTTISLVPTIERMSV